MGMSAATYSVLALGASGISAFGQIQESNQRAQTQELNADIDRQQAEIVQTRGRLDIMRQKKAAKAFMGEQRAMYAKAGVAATGSVLDVVEESAGNAELDILLTEYNTFSEAQRLRTEASQRESEARMERASGYTRAGTKLLSSGMQTVLKFGVKK